MIHEEKSIGTLEWNLLGLHNVNNALAAIAAAAKAGVTPTTAISALATFKNVKRRMEVIGEAKGITLYDDFAHHPTAIKTTLSGLRAKVGKEARIITVLEFGSYTMRSGVHKDELEHALEEADAIFCKKPAKDWGLDDVLKKFAKPCKAFDDVDALVKDLSQNVRSGDRVIVMSNSGFDGIHQKLLQMITD